MVGREANPLDEFHFGGPILRALANPTLEFKEEIYAFPMPGSRDALCSLIGAEADTLELDEDRFIGLRTRDGRDHYLAALIMGGGLPRSNFA